MSNISEYYVICHPDSEMGYYWHTEDDGNIREVYIDATYGKMFSFDNIGHAKNILQKIQNNICHLTHIDSEHSDIAYINKLDKSKFEIRKMVAKYCLRGRIE